MDRDLNNGKENEVIDTEGRAGRGTGGVAAWVVSSYTKIQIQIQIQIQIDTNEWRSGQWKRIL